MRSNSPNLEANDLPPFQGGVMMAIYQGLKPLA